MHHVTLRLLVLLVCVCSLGTAGAQVLFVNDNDNILYNTDTVLSDLTGTGILFDTYDIATEGTPPPYSTLSNYAVVIWYCSGDGAGLNFWNPTVQDDLIAYALDGTALWVIGTDVLYGNYTAPTTFQPGDMAQDILGLASYDVQSYGDDGNLGCPQMDVVPGLGTTFANTLLWTFPTCWWADGCTPFGDADAIYTMGPANYALAGSIAMVHNNATGFNVMSTFFDPALIDTYANRVLFLQQTLQYITGSSGIVASTAVAPTLTVVPNASGDLAITCTEPLRSVLVYTAAGTLVRQQAAMSSTTILAASGLAAGVHVVVATTASGARLNARCVVR